MPTGARSGTAARLVVLADTHLRTPGPGAPATARAMPDTVLSHLGQADAILHAGDVLDAGVLSLLGRYAPVFAVLGNNDTALVGELPVTRVLELGGMRIGMVHDSGPTAGRPARMRRRFPDCDVVVFGHSHTPVDEFGVGGQLLFNPGSPTLRRAQPVHTLGVLLVAGGAVLDHRIVPLG